MTQSRLRRGAPSTPPRQFPSTTQPPTRGIPCGFERRRSSLTHPRLRGATLRGDPLCRRSLDTPPLTRGNPYRILPTSWGSDTPAPIPAELLRHSSYHHHTSAQPPHGAHLRTLRTPPDTVTATAGTTPHTHSANAARGLTPRSAAVSATRRSAETTPPRHHDAPIRRVNPRCTERRLLVTSAPAHPPTPERPAHENDTGAALHPAHTRNTRRQRQDVNDARAAA